MTQLQRCWIVLNSARLVVNALEDVVQQMTYTSKQQATPHIRAVARNIMEDGLPGYQHKADSSIFFSVDDLGDLCHYVALYDEARKLRFASLQWRETFWGATEPMYRKMDNLEAEETLFPYRFQYDQGEELFKSAVEDCENNPWGFGRRILEARAVDSMSYVHDEPLGELECLLLRLSEMSHADTWRKDHPTGLAMVATLGALSMYEHPRRLRFCCDVLLHIFTRTLPRTPATISTSLWLSPILVGFGHSHVDLKTHRCRSVPTI